MGELKKIEAKGQWKKIFQEDNRSSVAIDYTLTYSTGLNTTDEDETTITATNSSTTSISMGSKFTVENIETSLSVDHSITSSKEKTTRNLTKKEISKKKEVTQKFTVPPKTNIQRWQLYVQILGNEFEFDEIVTTEDNKIPAEGEVVVTLRVAREIVIATTPIRIRHKNDGRYIMIVTRKNWPAATLGHNTLNTFVLHGSTSGGFRIRSVQQDAYKFLYSSDQGGIYFDTDSDNRKQYWYLSKATPLYDGAVVTFRNSYFDDSYLCHYTETQSNVDVYCIQKREDLWVLEVA